MEKLNGYKTVIFFGLALAIKIASLFGFGDFHAAGDQQAILDFVSNHAVEILAIGGLVLRWFTTSPIFNKAQG